MRRVALTRFLTEFCSRRPNKGIPVVDFIRVYNLWAKKDGSKKASRQMINSGMRHKGFREGKVYTPWIDNGERKYINTKIWVGLKWKDELTKEERQGRCKNGKIDSNY